MGFRFDFFFFLVCLLIFPSELKTPSSLKLIINLSLSTSSFPGEHKGRRSHETGMASPELLPSELPSQDTRTQNLGPVWRAGSALEANGALPVPGVSLHTSIFSGLKALRTSAARLLHRVKPKP